MKRLALAPLLIVQARRTPRGEESNMKMRRFALGLLVLLWGCAGEDITAPLDQVAEAGAKADGGSGPLVPCQRRLTHAA